MIVDTLANRGLRLHGFGFKPAGCTYMGTG